MREGLNPGAAPEKSSPGPGLVFIVAFAFVASITVLRPTPWLDVGPDFNFTMSAVWAGAALLAGLLSRRPSILVPCLLLACIGPNHRIAILSSFLCGVVLLVRTLYAERGDLRGFLRRAFTEKGAGYVLAIGVYMCFVWLVRLGDSTDGWSFLALGASMFTVPLAVYSLSYLPWTRDEARKAAVNTASVLGAVAAVVLLMPALTGNFEQYGIPVYVFYKAASSVRTLPFSMEWVNPDFNSASLRSAHYASVILIMLSFGFAAAAFHLKSRRRPLLAAAILAGFAALMGENVHALPGLLTALLLLAMVAIKPVMLRPSLAAPLITAAAVTAAVFTVFVFYNMTDYLSKLPKAALYSKSIEYAAERPFRMLFGEGPAAFSSHAAYKRLPAGLRDEQPFPLLPVFTPPPYGEVLHKAIVPNTFTTVHRPISGLLGLFMEWGIAGTLLLLIIITRLVGRMLLTLRNDDPVLKSAAAASLASFGLLFVLLGFRPYFEYPDVMSVAAVGFLIAGVGARN